jgi:hypothetical protein
MERSLMRRVILVLVAFAFVLFLFVFAFIRGSLSPEHAVFAMLPFVLATWMILTMILLNAQKERRKMSAAGAHVPEASDEKRALRNIRACKAMLVLMVLSLVFGLMTDWKKPIRLLVVPVGINLLLTWAIARALREQQAKLRK